jgi:thiamine biosynthesis lipoprotein
MALHSFSFSAMGTACTIHLYSGSDSAAHGAAAAAVAEVERLEQRYSRYRADSVLSQINAVAARGGTLSVDGETAGLLDYAFACYRKSDGLFDITSGIMRRAWNFSTPRLPERDEIDRLLPLVGLNKLEWDPPRLHMPIAGMEIDFGGIVKEYAADRAAAVCMNLDIGQGIVELGGDVRVIGPHPHGAPWQIGIRHPRSLETTMATVALAGGGLASSGDYERFIEIGGIRYCHLLNPRTGWPVRGLAGVSVVAETCLVAGSVASIAMLKQQDGTDWLAKLDVRYLWMDEAGQQGGNLPSQSR